MARISIEGSRFHVINRPLLPTSRLFRDQSPEQKAKIRAEHDTYLENLSDFNEELRGEVERLIKTLPWERLYSLMSALLRSADETDDTSGEVLRALAAEIDLIWSPLHAEMEARGYYSAAFRDRGEPPTSSRTDRANDRRDDR